MKAYKLFRGRNRGLLDVALTEFEQRWESVEIEGMNTVQYRDAGECEELIVETIVLVSYETGEEVPA